MVWRKVNCPNVRLSYCPTVRTSIDHMSDFLNIYHPIVRLPKCLDVKSVRKHKFKFSKCQIVLMSDCQNVQLSKCPIVILSNGRIVKWSERLNINCLNVEVSICLIIEWSKYLTVQLYDVQLSECVSV
jgi:hypothetical protein